MNWLLLQNSLIVSVGAMVLAVCLGVPASWLAAALPAAARRFAVMAGIAAFALPPFLITNTWLHYFGLTGSWRPFVDFNLYSLPGTILLLAFTLWPIPFFFSLQAILRIDRVYLEQDPFLRGPALVRHLVWPLSKGAITLSGVLVFILALNNFSIPALLQTKVYAAEVWLAFNTRFDYRESLSLSWPLITGPVILLLLFRGRNLNLAFRTTNFPNQLFRRRLGRPILCIATTSAGLCAALLLLPAWQLVSATRTWTEFLPAIQASRNAAFDTVLFALGSAAIVMVAGTLLIRTKPLFASWAFYLMPGVLIGIALIWLLNRPYLAGFYQSAGIVLLAFSIRFLALGWSGARIAQANTDRTLPEMLRVFGGRSWQIYRLADWPQSKPLLLASFYLIYLLALWEVETLILIVPPGHETLGLRIFNMLHYGHAGQVNALCVWLLILAVAPLLVWMATRKIGRVWHRLAALCVPLLLLGCAAEPENQTRIKSSLFSSVQVIGSRGTGAGQFNKPRSLAVDSKDNLYVVDLTGRVQKFTPDGEFLLSWQMPQTDKGKPKGMIQDIDGNVILIEPHYSRVNHFGPEGELLAQWGAYGTNQGELTFPRSAAINSRGEIFLSEYGQVERIQHFTHKGSRFLKIIGRGGTGPGEFNRPEGLGIDLDDRLYVADSCNHRVQIFSPDGKFLAAFGTPGSGPGEMSYPYDVRIDPLGYRFVCEFGNSRVQIFDENGSSVAILGGAGTEPGQMNNPWAIALDSRGNLYVADSANHRVQKFLRREPLPPQPAHTVRAAPKQVAAR